jgi:quinol monooxygenase YgiN
VTWGVILAIVLRVCKGGKRPLALRACQSAKSAYSIVFTLMKAFFTLVATFLFLMTSSPAAESPYRHVVFFKFKDSASAEQVQNLEKAFAELAKKIATVKSFEWGTNVSPEGLNDGFTHCFLVTFADKEGLDIYLPHPEHQAFVAQLKPMLDKVCVLDYVVR